ncbi:MAG: 4Fe-4S dicluster domain-containing protein [Flammeovirgaceae bacterium]
MAQIAVTLFQILCFLGALTAVSILLVGRIKFIKRNILLGKPIGGIDPASKGERMKKMLMLAFGQQKMFDKPLVGLLHFAVYAGFLIVNIEVLEIILDGIFGTHRMFSGVLGSLYPVLINFFEILAFTVVVSCVIFFLRRNSLKIPRFHKDEMKGWAFLDANIILVWEIVLMFFLLTMNATDSILQTRIEENAFVKDHYPVVGTFAISQFLIPLYEGFNTYTLIFLERAAWWLHIVGIFGFAVYVTYSKHLHILLAFPNTYYMDLKSRGEIENMPEVTKEVKIMMGELEDDGGGAEDEFPSFGAKEVTDLTWKNLMDAYSCTECGRCTAECPANQTGKKLSPRKIMMDTRDRVEEYGINIDENGEFKDDGKKLYGDYITKEELMACTTCNACVEACPVSINPLDIILKMRRYVAMEESDTPQSWNMMFQNIENNFAPWAFSASDRFNWADELAAEAAKSDEA